MNINKPSILITYLKMLPCYYDTVTVISCKYMVFLYMRIHPLQLFVYNTTIQTASYLSWVLHPAQVFWIINRTSLIFLEHSFTFVPQKQCRINNNVHFNCVRL